MNNSPVQGDVRASRFCHSELIHFSGIKNTTWRAWLRAGKVSLGAKTSANQRIYSRLDLLKARLINELSLGGGLPAEIAADAAEHAQDWLIENFETDGANDPEASLVAYAHGGPSLAPNRDLLNAILILNAEPATVINLSRFLSEAALQNTQRVA